MKTIIAVTLFLFCFSSVYAEIKQNAVKNILEAHNRSADALKNELILALQMEEAGLGKDKSEEKNKLKAFIDLLKRGRSPSDFRRLQQWKKSYTLNAESLKLYEGYIKQFKLEEKESGQKIQDLAKSSLKKSFSAKSKAEVKIIQNNLKERTDSLNKYSYENSNQLRTLINHTNSSLGYIASVKAYTENSPWRDISSQIKSISISLKSVESLIPPEEAKLFIESLCEKYHLPQPDQISDMLQEVIADLFDDQKQDDLNQITKRISKIESLVNYSTAIHYNVEQASKWRLLESIANKFSRAVYDVKNGQVSSFSPESWYRNQSASLLMPRKEMVQILKNYKVKLLDKEGGQVEEVMYYDMREIWSKINQVSEIQKYLPLMKKAKRFNSRSSSRYNWTHTISALDSMLSMRMKLTAGAAYPLANNRSVYYQANYSFNALAAGHPASAKLKRLDTELKRMILHRFYPDVLLTDKTSIQKILSKKFHECKQKKDYEQILRLNLLSQFFFPKEILISPEEVVAIRCYLAGVRQDKQLKSVRLATYYFQRCAAIPSEIIPLKEIATKLNEFKKSSPLDYEKGVDDLFKANPSSPVIHGLSFQTQLIVPASE